MCLFQKDRVGRIILAGGVAPSGISESRAMADLFCGLNPNLETSSEVLLLDEKSLDTAGNMEEALKIMDLYGLGNEAVLLTFWLHLRRSLRLGENFGIKFIGQYLSDQIVSSLDAASRASVMRYRRSPRAAARFIHELFLTALLPIDPTARIPRELTKRIRGASKD